MEILWKYIQLNPWSVFQWMCLMFLMVESNAQLIPDARKKYIQSAGNLKEKDLPGYLSHHNKSRWEVGIPDHVKILDILIFDVVKFAPWYTKNMANQTKRDTIKANLILHCKTLKSKPAIDRIFPISIVLLSSPLHFKPNSLQYHLFNTTVRLNTRRPICGVLKIRLNIVDFIPQWMEHENIELVTVLMSDTSGIIRDNGIMLHSSRDFRRQFRPEIVLQIPEPCESHDHFQCSTGECKPGNVRCNFLTDCPTGNDEMGCGYHCDFNNRTTCGWVIEKMTPNITGLILANGSNVDKAPNDYVVMFKGKYMRPGDRARLISQWFSNTAKNGECKLKFFFYMNGSSRPGELDVKVHTLSGRQISLTKYNANYLNDWHEQSFEIGDIAEPFRIFFMFTREGDRGTIGLDDIEVTCSGQYKIKESPLQGQCPKISFACSTSLCKNLDQVCDYEEDCLYGDDEKNCDELVPTFAKCTFEDSLCGWRVIPGRGLIWERVVAGSIKPVKENPSPHLIPSMAKLTHYARLANGGNRGRSSSKAPNPVDHTYKNTSGHYMMMIKDPKAVRTPSSRSSDGCLESPLYPAPPPETYCNRTSRYYQLCKVRLFFAAKHPLTSLYMEFHQQNMSKKDVITKVVKSTDDETFVRSKWIRVVIVVPDKITQPFRINLRGYYFSTSMNYDHLVVDDISLSPECFGKGKLAEINSTDRICKGLGPKPTGVIPTVTTDLGYIGNRVPNSTTAWTFTTCGQNGAQGPTQIQCDSAYRHKKISIRVIGDTSPSDTMKMPRGTQIWKIPATGRYGVTAIGAAGGHGVKNNDRSNSAGFDPSFGSSVYARFDFKKDEEVYMVVGQFGESACAKPNHRGVSEKVQRMCELGITDKNDADFFTNKSGGGGGGGGATYVFKLDSKGKAVPLIIASGGGGRSYRAKPYRHRVKDLEKKILQSCRTFRLLRYPGHNAPTALQGPGGGGGWNDTRMYKHVGQSLVEGSEGGDSCRKALQGLGWHISGGFGGGGGACSAGGGGGGYKGGNVADEDDYEVDGWFGDNYIAMEGDVDDDLPMEEYCGLNDKDGDVTFEQNCPCEQFCQQQTGAMVCGCRHDFSLAEDGIHCIQTAVVIKKEPIEKPGKPPIGRRTEKAPEDDLSTTALIGIIIGVIIATVIITFFFVLFLRKQKHKRQMAMRLEVLTGFTAPADSQLERLRQTNAITEHNPHYDVCGAKCSLDDLMQTPRESLTLVSALGQGAFGEVYKGYLVNFPADKPGDLPVAVKTLPAMSTEQSEMDFLMEALIMSKFDDPYIVKFIGVCFEKHPRYLILELLAGGDLKSFLRDNRPKPFQPSPLSMRDLLQCAIDIAKGCYYLEMNHFIHRDIAARNCLLTSKGPDRVVKIADFGMARDVYRADYYRKGGKAMLPVKWMPPEAFMDGIFTSKTDTWSFGILLWEVFSLGYMPYPGRGNQEVMQFVAAGGRLDPPTNCPTPVYRIMTQCWHAMYERRPNFTTILERLDYCMQDPDVIDARLPTFSRRPSLENDFTIMRPKFTDPALSIGSAKKYSHMDSDIEDSTEHLLQDDLLESKKHANMFASAESLDKLLTDDNAKEDHESDSETVDGASLYSTDTSAPNTPGLVQKSSPSQSQESLSDKLDELDELVSSNRSLSIPIGNGFVKNGCLLSNSPAVMENSNPEEVVLNGFGHHDEEEDAIIDELTNGNDLDNDPLITRQHTGHKHPVEKMNSLDGPVMNGDHDTTDKVRRTSQTSQNSNSNSINNLAKNMERVNNYYVKSLDRPPTTRLPNGTDQSEWKVKNGGPPRQFESSIV